MYIPGRDRPQWYAPSSPLHACSVHTRPHAATCPHAHALARVLSELPCMGRRAMQHRSRENWCLQRQDRARCTHRYDLNIPRPAATLEAGLDCAVSTPIQPRREAVRRSIGVLLENVEISQDITREKSYSIRVFYGSLTTK